MQDNVEQSCEQKFWKWRAIAIRLYVIKNIIIWNWYNLGIETDKILGKHNQLQAERYDSTCIRIHPLFLKKHPSILSRESHSTAFLFRLFHKEHPALTLLSQSLSTNTENAAFCFKAKMEVCMWYLPDIAKIIYLHMHVISNVCEGTTYAQGQSKFCFHDNNSEIGEM